MTGTVRNLQSPSAADPPEEGRSPDAGPAPHQRPERADKARNRTRILAAASDAFAETGLDTQMDAIAARAGLGVGTLYRHFATKEALMIAMVERKFEQILTISRRAVEQAGEAPFEAFADVLRAGAQVAAADASTQEVLIRGGEEVKSGVAGVLEELRAANQVLIDRAQAAGTLRSDMDADDIPMIMCGVSATMATRDWDWRRHLEIVLDGLRASDQR